MCTLKDQTSNNQAEYKALIMGLVFLATMKANTWSVKGILS